MDADDILIGLDRISERRIQEAIDAGEFDNLPGMGKALTHEDNPFVPEDMRVAFKVLANSGYAPDWMVLSQQIEEDLAKLRHDADRHFTHLRASLKDLGSDPYAIRRLRQEVDRLKAKHKRAAAGHRVAVEEINRKINLFNQMTPIASILKVPLSVELEMERYEDRVPGYLSYVTRDA
jgi:hypothetical protein